MHSRNLHSFRILWIILLIFTTSLVNATCYWQNSTLAPDDPNSIAPDDTACFPDQDNSPCCGTGWTCLSDGVCYIQQNGVGFYYRGTCTDRTWNSQQCPGWCFAQNSNSSIPLAKCQKSTGEDWYCCPGDPNCSCDTGKDALKLGASAPSTITVIGSTSWPGFTSTTAPFTASPLVTAGTSTNTGTTSSSSTSSTSSSSSSLTNPTSTTASAGAAANTNPPTSSSSSSSSSSNVGLAAGLGAGLGGGIALIGAGLSFWYFRRRNRKTAATNNTSTLPGYNVVEAPQRGYYEPQKKFPDSQGQPGELPSSVEHTRSEMDANRNTGPRFHEME